MAIEYFDAVQNFENYYENYYTELTMSIILIFNSTIKSIKKLITTNHKVPSKNLTPRTNFPALYVPLNKLLQQALQLTQLLNNELFQVLMKFASYIYTSLVYVNTF